MKDTYIIAEQQRIAIAEACGWDDISEPYDTEIEWTAIPPGGIFREKLPDYLSDLNAMHEAEKRLTEAQWSTYSVTLNEIACRLHGCGNIKTCGYTLAATAAQRAEAFLRTMKNTTDNLRAVNLPRLVRPVQSGRRGGFFDCARHDWSAYQTPCPECKAGDAPRRCYVHNWSATTPCPECQAGR
jgi:hypothetical protein